MRIGAILTFCVALATSIAAAEDRTAQIVSAPNAPVRLESAKLLNTGSAPLVLLYAATNTLDAPIDQFTVMVFVYDKDGNLKARQVAPGRRELKVKETKFSAMVLDVGRIEPSDYLMAGVDQAQRAGSEEWWRADLRPIAEAAADVRRGAAAPRGK